MDIVDIVNRDTFQKPFEPIIRKLDRQIDKRARFVFQNGILIDQETMGRPTPLTTQSDWVPKASHSRNVSPPNLSEFPSLEPTSKQERITNLADRLSGLTTALQEKRKNAVISKFEGLQNLVQRINSARLADSFRKLVKELALQTADQLSRKGVKPNYATVRRYLSANLPKAIEQAEVLARRLAKKAVFEVIQTEAASKVMLQTRQRLALQGAFRALMANRDEEKSNRQKEKVVSFLMKLDTYLLLLKFNAFYSLKVD